MAAELGWSPFYLSRRLSGRTPFDVEDLGALAEALDLPVTAFFDVPVGAGIRKPGCYAPTMPTRLSLAAAA